nr:transcriptional co-activator (Hfi1/Ada1) [Aspergillus niger CBS 513.88]|eukprot:XP_001400593.2 transcriptional co-activator (Hfi1/Ada1) [Aspergillus niger CBS 513.88]
MQIDPAALSRTDSASTTIASSKSTAPNAPPTQKSTKALISVPRLDLEPIYTELKAAIGDNWADYKEATSLFLLDWELEIRKRYAQPLASESGEFPDAESIHARMVPICYEESIVSGASLPCAEFMAIATETFVKEVLSVVFSRTRSNGPSGTINGMMMRKYRQQLESEELAFTRGEIVKDSATGLLPVEAKEASTRKPLGVRDLRLSLELGGGVLSHMPLLVDQIMGGYLEDELETDKQDRVEEAVDVPDAKPDSFMDEMDVDEAKFDWEGGTVTDREQLGALLDECLSMAS